ncbi:Complex 1 LYR protein, partial [Trinorchestia longiramus]
ARSKLQQEVLLLYKQCLRAARSKPGFTDSVRYEFRKESQIARTDVLRIEHLLRQGKKKLVMMKDPHVTSMGRF